MAQENSQNLPFLKNFEFCSGNKALFDKSIITQFIDMGNSIVYEIEDENNQSKAMKVIELQNTFDQELYEREVYCLEKLQLNPHKNIVHYFGNFIAKEIRNEKDCILTGHIIMEKGITNLQNVIENRINTQNYFTDEEVLKFIQDMLEALIHIQKLNIAHRLIQNFFAKIIQRDLKPKNILLIDSQNMEFKICDVGSGTLISETSRPTQFRTVTGTPNYLSPELFELNQNRAICGVYDPYKSDVYSLGLCILHLVSFQKITSNQR